MNLLCYEGLLVILFCRPFKTTQGYSCKNKDSNWESALAFPILGGSYSLKICLNFEIKNCLKNLSSFDS